VFGFHLASLDIRQNSDVHERVMAELVETAGARKGLRQARRAGARALLSAELANPRPLATPNHDYSEETANELVTAAGRGGRPSPLRRRDRCRTT
jgi:phosphoenolpyruvate carboxylase